MYKSKQEIFNKVAKHLLTQGKQAVDWGKTCQYRAPDGTMCAVGCLLPDSHYQKGFEGEALSDIWNAIEDLFSVKDNDDNVMIFLEELQEIHDSEPDPERWPDDLISLADRYNLNYEVVSEYA